MALRLLTDLAVITSTVIVEEQEVWGMGFQPPKSSISRRLSFENMLECFKETPGLVADKLKAILELIWRCLKPHGVKVSVICPGPMDTPMRWAATPDWDRAKVIPPQRIADLIALLVASPDSTIEELYPVSLYA